MKLIYDGDCGFCSKSVNFGKVRFKKPVEVVPWQQIDDLSLYGLSIEDVTSRVYFIDNKGKPFGGAKGVFKSMKQMNKAWVLLGSLLLTPGVSVVANPVYRVIARNRHKLPGSTDACKIPDEK